MRYDIKEVLPISTTKVKNSLWNEIEEKLGFDFPQDYKKFIDTYGEGAINGFLWILSPFSKNVYLNSIEKFKVMGEAFNSLKADFPKYFSVHMFNGKNGLFPWGITDNGDELFWDYENENMEIIVFASRYSESIKYPMTMEEFLGKLLEKEIACSIFPEDFVLDNNYYETIN